MKKIVSVFFITALLVGCAGSPIRTGWEAEANRKSILGLNIGMTKMEVIQVMGEPRTTEAYSMEGQNTEFWLYLTEGTIIGDGRMGDKNFTPLAFENGILIGWGRNFYDQALKYEHKIDIK